MIQPRIGQHVVCPTGVGTVDTITVGHAGSDVLRYRITTSSRRRWYYLDELIVPDTHPRRP